MTTKRIKVEALARVEGEGALDVKVRNGTVTDLKFRIYEPPRFFEALLRGRQYSDAPDITARICGICPVAYLLGAAQAMEDALGVDVPPEITALRRLIYTGEWIESHVLHVAMLHAPDFLGLDDSLQMARTHPDVVTTALRLKKLGNALLEVIGGRAVHPVNLKVGGFYSVPSRQALTDLLPEIEWGIEAARTLARTVATFDFPDLERDYLFVALHHPDEYAIARGTLRTSEGVDVALPAFEQHFGEHHVKHSNALHGLTSDGRPYHVGPLARYAVNFDALRPDVQDEARATGLGPVVRNPFKSIIVRSLEVLQALLDARDLIAAYQPPENASAVVRVRAGEGVGCTEAPRGICWHRYRLNDDGTIAEARIVPPTSQNQPTIEEDLREVVTRGLNLPDDALQWRCEQAIRNYDPCISCATHFLRLKVDRG
ncbi:Ni/Fe hydrogenase subunit alpha [Caenispirillum salinarum]|uniref:Ni/Fe hydrogenase subunit alpha n=1 Tax=Caenispirillum salinarum TaxID=859058 RepID=UPI00384BB50C